MDINNKLISILLETLYQSDKYLTDQDKKEFSLMYRCIHSINEIWSSNKTAIKSLDVSLLSKDMLRIQVNDSSPVTYIYKVYERPVLHQLSERLC